MSEIFETILSAAITKTNGINTLCIKFPIKFTKNNITGSIILLVVILPVKTISDVSNGISKLINPTMLTVASFTIFTTSEKFVIIIVTINIY